MTFESGAAIGVLAESHLHCEAGKATIGVYVDRHLNGERELYLCVTEDGETKTVTMSLGEAGLLIVAIRDLCQWLSHLEDGK